MYVCSSSCCCINSCIGRSDRSSSRVIHNCCSINITLTLWHENTAHDLTVTTKKLSYKDSDNGWPFMMSTSRNVECLILILIFREHWNVYKL